MTKAIAYTRRVISGNGEVIPCGSQVELIRNFAAENSLEIVACFTDDGPEEDILKRPGIQALLSYAQPYELVVFERVWALSRSMPALEPFLQELDRRGVGYQSATPLWDLLSQQCRRRSKFLPVLPPVLELRDNAVKFRRYRVARPARLNFEHLVHHAHPSISPRL